MGKYCKREFICSWRGTQWEFLHEGKACGFIVEVLRDQGIGSIGTMTKFCVTDNPLKHEGWARVRDEMLYESVRGTKVCHWKTCKQVQIHMHNWKLYQMIHESWYGHSHPDNDHVNGSKHGCSHPLKAIIMKPMYGRSHPIMRRITYVNSWYGRIHPSERDMYINIIMSHHFATWTLVIWA